MWRMPSNHRIDFSIRMVGTLCTNNSDSTSDRADNLYDSWRDISLMEGEQK